MATQLQTSARDAAKGNALASIGNGIDALCSCSLDSVGDDLDRDSDLYGPMMMWPAMIYELVEAARRG